MKKFALVGKPISKSLSPMLFAAAYQNSDFEFSLFETTDCKAVEKALRTNELCGVNVTAPIKIDVLSFVDEQNKDVKIIGATNTIKNHNGKLIAYNVDFLGVLGAFGDFKIDLQNKNCIVLGAGGAGMAAAYALTKSGARVTIINRTEKKAENIAQKLNCDFAAIEKINELVRNCDIVVNTISANVLLMDENSLFEGQIIFDASYQHSNLLKIAAEKKCVCIDGRFWLLHQAIAGYKIFTDCEPNVLAMRNFLGL